MFTGSMGGGGFEGSHHRAIDPSVTWTEAPTNYRTPEGKAAKGLVASLDKMSFDTGIFAYLVASDGGQGMRRRILNVAIDIIRHYAGEWESGGSQDEVSRDAMRLLDTLRTYKM